MASAADAAWSETSTEARADAQQSELQSQILQEPEDQIAADSGIDLLGTAG